MACAGIAGFPSPPDDHAEGKVDLAQLLIENRPTTFIARVQGVSMTEAAMFDGDLAIVDRSFKIWHERQGRVMLSFANARYPAFVLRDDGEVDVWGVVANTIGLGRRCEIPSATSTGTSARSCL
jgi:DNA polymerase V